MEQTDSLDVQITNSSRTLTLRVDTPTDFVELISALYALDDISENSNFFKFGSFAPVRLTSDVMPYIGGQGLG